MIDLNTLVLTREPEREQTAIWGKWNRTPRVLKSYRVTTPDGTVLGRVYQRMTTFDIKPRGSRVVTKRWESPRWYADVERRAGRRSWAYETRKRALEDLVAMVSDG